MRDDLRGYLRRRVADEHAAEDLLQETIARVHDRLPELPPRERIEPWVMRIARNALIDFQRRAGRGEALDDPVSPDAEPALDNRNHEVRAWLPGFVALLPPETRAALELAELEGLPLRAVAERLGISHAAAKSRVQRGRARMRAMLEACCRFELDRRGNVLDYSRRGDGCACDE
jgi:RNA polymerase sigma-70 factor (ECF subfamily)